MRILAPTLALASCAGPDSPCGDPAEPSVAPGPGGGGNVLIVILDDVGAEMVGAYGRPVPRPPTPTLDCLCARGVRFDRAWSTPLCSPTRAALLTGRAADKTGVGYNVRPSTQLDHGEVTLAERVSEAGVRTGYVGKWHLDGWDSPGGLIAPLLQGFEAFAGTVGNLGEAGAPDPLFADDTDYYGYWRSVNGVVRWWSRYATTQEVDDALALVDRMGDGPWLLVLALHAPHVPFHRPPARLLSEPLPADATPPEQYRAALEAADTELGRLLREIDPEVLADTTVIVVGDNGTEPDAAVDPARAKNTLYEGGVNVPLIVSGPHVSRPGVSQALVHVTDLLPTVLEIHGLDAPPDLDGVSVLDVLGDPAVPGPDLVATVFDPRGQGVERAIRDDRHKLIRHHGGREELYDLQADPDEAFDLVAAGALDPDAAAALARLDSALADPLNVPRFDVARLRTGERRPR